MREQFAPTRMISATAFGARAGTDEDSASAIRDAVRAAQRQDSPAIVELDSGRYRCIASQTGPGWRHGCIEIDDACDLTIEGNGATLVGSSLCNLFLFRKGRNIVVRNIDVEWDPLPYVAGRVVAVDRERYAFDIAPRGSAEASVGRVVKGILAYDGARRRLADNGWEIYQTKGERDADPVERTPDGNLRIFQGGAAPLPEIGWDVVVRHEIYGFDAFVFSHCENVLLENVTVRAVPGMAFRANGSRDLVVRGLRVVPDDDEWMSATADAMHFDSCRGQVTIEDSAFAGMGDDAINIHGMYGLALERADDRRLVAARARLHPYYDSERTAWDPPAQGDVIEYGYGEQPLIARGRFSVDASHNDEARKRTLIVAQDALPADVGPGAALWNLSTSPSIRIRNCRVRGNRARGMLLQSRDVIVEDCEFEDISGAGIQICTDAADWWESLGSRNVSVRRCTFRRNNFGVARRTAALDIFCDLPGGKPGGPGVHGDIRILDNVFEGNSGAAVHVGSAEGVELRNNKISPDHAQTVVIDNSRDVTIDGEAV